MLIQRREMFKLGLAASAAGAASTVAGGGPAAAATPAGGPGDPRLSDHQGRHAG